MIIAQRIALNPNNKQATYLRRACGVARFAYNWGLAEWRRQYEAGEKPTWPAIARKLNAIKREQFPWMMEVTNCAAAYSSKNLGIAFQRFFSKQGNYPQFKKKGVRDSFGIHPDEMGIKGKRVRVPKIGWLNSHETLRFHGVIKTASISCSGGKWFLSVAVEAELTFPQSESQAAVGVDLGVSVLATLSDGEKIAGPKPHRAVLLRLRRLNKSLSRKVKGSSNRDKAKQKLSRLHSRIGNIRKDALHKLTHRLTRDFGVIGVESLNVAGMVKNRRLARAISDMGFYEFKRQLLYKAVWRGVRVVEVDRFYPSSKTCSTCGFRMDTLPLSVREWDCRCGARHDRDINAAINLKNKAVEFTVSACGVGSSGGGSASTTKLPTLKQESTNSRKAVEVWRITKGGESVHPGDQEGHKP